VPDRLPGVLRSLQLKVAAASGLPTMLVVYDNTPFKIDTQHDDHSPFAFALAREIDVGVIVEQPLQRLVIGPQCFDLSFELVHFCGWIGPLTERRRRQGL
jgi:hypothetical protein